MDFKETKNLPYDRVVEMFYLVGFLKHQYKREQYKKAIEAAFRNSQYVLSAWDDDTLVGFVRVISDNVLFATIWNLIIHPYYQKKGIGKQFVQKCLDRFPMLHTSLIADKESVGFYKKLGFKLHPFGMYLEEGKKKCVIYN